MFRFDRLAVLAVVACVGACNKDTPPPPPAPVPPPASGGKAAPAGQAVSGTDGGGNGTGTSIANARALRNGTPVNFALSCTGVMYFGPFRLTHDPETLKVLSTIKSPSGAQICPKSEWLDASGAHVAGAGMGCIDDKHVGEGTPSYEYSPGNGGSSTSVVYLRVAAPDEKQPGCPSLDVTLRLPPR